MRTLPVPVQYLSAKKMEISPHEIHPCNAARRHDNCLLLVEEQKIVDIEEPHHHDVLCGRGVTTNRHPGNESFRSLVGLNKEVYVSSTKTQKMRISRSIVEAVRSLDPPGRFLEKHPCTGLWSDVGHKKAVEKTSQALRDGAASLRKQLSADLGDPEFLNAVFDIAKNDDQEKSMMMEIEGRDEADKKSVNGEDSMGSSDHPKTKKLAEKINVIKKAKSVVAKKGHRRTRSHPGSEATLTKRQRRSRPTEAPPSPLTRYADRHPQIPPSPRSPPARQSMSHPNSPMTWGVRVSYHENESPRSLGSIPSHSPYYEPQPPSPSSSSHYGHPSNHQQYGRSPSFDYQSPHHYYPPHESRSHYQHPHSRSFCFSRYNGSSYNDRPAIPPTHSSSSSMPYSWQPSPGSYGHYSGHPPPGSRTPPRPPRPASPPPSSLLPQSPLPPGRHQFSPAGYQSNRSSSEWSSAHDTPHRHDRHERHSDRSLMHHDEGKFSSERSPQWRSQYSYHHFGASPPGACSTSVDSGNSIASSGLSVPTLRGESRYSSKVTSSPRVMLTPRSRTTFAETPRRPRGHRTREFDPPPPSPRFRRVHHDSYAQEDHLGRGSRIASPPGEEKKTEFEASQPYPSLASSSSSPTQIMSSEVPIFCEPKEAAKEVRGEDIIKADDRISITHASPSSLPRASPVSARISAVVVGTEASAHVEDIAISPIPFDCEDPSTLMELPENLLELPISPCGPHDDPLA